MSEPHKVIPPHPGDLASRIIDYEAGKLDDEAVVELFQELVNCGMAWRLQGFYGRTAKAMLDAGLISMPPR